MTRHSCAPYRGYAIELHVGPDAMGTLGSNVQGYALRWTASLADAPNDEVVSFAEQSVFITEFDAIAYGEARAHAFIDHLLSLHAPKRDPADRQGNTEQTFKA